MGVHGPIGAGAGLSRITDVLQLHCFLYTDGGRIHLAAPPIATVSSDHGAVVQRVPSTFFLLGDFQKRAFLWLKVTLDLP